MKSKLEECGRRAVASGDDLGRPIRLDAIRAAEREALFQIALLLVFAIAVTLAAIVSVSAKERHGLITVESAAGPITVAPEFAPKIVPFIAAVVALAGKPAHIKCFSTAASHVPGSLHFVGRACDFDQRAWGRTRFKIIYQAAALARRYGLRDGCEFRDWGHIDDGPHLPASRTRGCKSGPFVAWSQIGAAGAP